MTWSGAQLGHRLAVWSRASHRAPLNSDSSNAKWVNGGSHLAGLPGALGEVLGAERRASCPAHG